MVGHVHRNDIGRDTILGKYPEREFREQITDSTSMDMDWVGAFRIFNSKLSSIPSNALGKRQQRTRSREIENSNQQPSNDSGRRRETDGKDKFEETVSYYVT